MKAPRYAQLQADLDHATEQLAHQDDMRREASRWTRELDRQRWQIKFREAEHLRYISRWRRMWDGRID